jgi:NitT/TauT family transport system permease protein
MRRCQPSPRASSFAVASVLGVRLAVALTFSAWVREALYPSIIMFQLIPKIALAPLFIVWLGVGKTTSVAVAVFIAFFPIVVSTATGLVSAKPEVLRLCESLTASGWQAFCMVRFPYALPYVFAGMKVGVTMAMIGVVVGEFITAQHGLGYIIMPSVGCGLGRRVVDDPVARRAAIRVARRARRSHRERIR